MSSRRCAKSVIAEPPASAGSGDCADPVAPLDPERALALAYVPAGRRSAIEALWRLDVTLGAVLVTGRDPMVSRIRLAWWREALERLDHQPPPPEPILSGVAAHLLPHGIAGADLAAMEEGWEILASPGPLTTSDLEDYAKARGGTLFALSARLLGSEDRDERVARAGEAWALIDLARRSRDPREKEEARAAARSRAAGGTWPARLRPLGMLAMLAFEDARGPRWQRQGSPRRVLRMVRHRFTGR